MNDSTVQVQQASQKMTSDSRTIMKEVTSLQDESVSMKKGMDEMGASAEKINTTGSALSKISAIVEQSIAEIGHQIDQFEV